MVPDGDHAATKKVTVATPASVATPILPEQIRFLSRTYKELEVILDPNTKCIWCYQRPKGPPSFTPNMVGELIGLRRAIQALTPSQGPNAERLIRSYIFASQIPGIYNLGGDLSLPRQCDP
jgi:DSF synthase